MADDRGEVDEKEISQVKSTPSKGNKNTHSVSGDKTTKDDSVLSSLNLKYNIRSQSSLSSVLKDYGLPEEKKKRKKKTDPESKTRRRHVEDFVEDEREKERRLLREKKCEQVMLDLDALKNHYYTQYMEMLKQRVKKQHIDIKQRSNDFARQVKEQKEAASQRVKKRLTKHTLTTDNSFLKDIQKTHIHEILARERKLRKEGKFKTLTDSELFWAKELNIPTSLTEISQKRGLPQNLLAMMGGGSSENLSVSDDDSENSMEQGVRKLSLYQIEEVSESRPSTREQNTARWAVTQQAQHVYKQPSRGKDRRRGSLNLTRKSKEKDKDEIQFPRVEMPKLHCFTMSLAKPPPDPVEEQRKVDLAIRERERKLFLYKLQKMYQLAMANTASANRILDKHDPDDLFLLMDGPNVSDKTSHYALKPSAIQHEGDGDAGFFLTNQTWPPGKYRIGTIPEEQESEVETRQSFVTHQTGTGEIVERTGSCVSEPSSRKGQIGMEDSERSKTMPEITREKSIPLSMNELVAQCPDEGKILESKGLSSFWINYMKAGKPVTVNT